MLYSELFFDQRALNKEVIHLLIYKNTGIKAALINISALARVISSSRQLFLAHCTLPTQRQTADRQSERLASEHSGAFSS